MTSTVPPGEDALLSDRLMYALELRQMSQTSLEQASKMSRGYVSRMRRGERAKLSPDVLRRVSDALHVSYEWLATGRGEVESRTAPPPAKPAASQLPFASLAPRAPAPPPAAEPRGISSLETAIAYHRAKWTPATLAAARAYALDESLSELAPDEWTGVLDQIEAALGKLKIAGKPR